MKIGNAIISIILLKISLQQDYYKALEDADEKVQLANQIYDLVSKEYIKCIF